MFMAFWNFFYCEIRCFLLMSSGEGNVKYFIQKSQRKIWIYTGIRGLFFQQCHMIQISWGPMMYPLTCSFTGLLIDSTWSLVHPWFELYNSDVDLCQLGVRTLKFQNEVFIPQKLSQERKFLLCFDEYLISYTLNFHSDSPFHGYNSWYRKYREVEFLTHWKNVQAL